MLDNEYSRVLHAFRRFNEYSGGRALSEEEIKDFLQLSPIYDRLSTEEKKALLEDVKTRYFSSWPLEGICLQGKSSL